MGTLIDGKALATTIHAETKALAATALKKGRMPSLSVILIGEDSASKMYCRMKGAAAEADGINFALHEYPSTITEDELVAEIEHIQKTIDPSGLILQLPLPEHLYTRRVLNAIDPGRDVDFLTNENLGSLIMNTATLLPPTPGAIIRMLDHLQVDLAGKNVTVVGTGALVGKPLVIMLANRGASVTTVNSRTADAKEKCRSAEVLISGVGKKDLITGDMIRPGAIVIDAGICFEGKKVFGDVNVVEALTVASHVTPTPGGVGPVTVALLLYNTAALAIASK